jgi:hypothetical protein
VSPDPVAAKIALAPPDSYLWQALAKTAGRHCRAEAAKVKGTLRAVLQLLGPGGEAIHAQRCAREQSLPR